MILYLVWLLCSTAVYGQHQEVVTPALEALSEYPKIRDFTLSKSGTEAYFTIQSPLEEVSVIAVVKKTHDGWGEPQLAPFSGNFQDLEPSFSPDNLRLYFASNRSLTEGDGSPKDYDIWYVERKTVTSQWGDPVNMGAPVNTDSNEFYPSVAENGNLYFTSDGPGTTGLDDIFLSIWSEERYLPPKPLDQSINSEGYEFNAFVAADESYLLYTAYNREGGEGSGDLYISFRNETGNWEPSINLGPGINSNQMDYCPFVDATTHTLYFTSRRSTLDSNQKFQTMDEVEDAINRYENGSSRIYRVLFDPSKLQKE